ncbi:MAG: hypothetical protein JNM56_00025 [Planctomycetia bacterium]|nr:hypothetical protein [Planctomycetia bacterium]
MPSIIHCPSCSRQLRVPEELAGHLVKCPGCGQTFTASFSASSVDAGAPPEAGTRPQAAPPPLPPTPPEPARPQASRPPEPPPWEDYRDQGYRRDVEAHRGALVLTFGILSLMLGLLGLPFGIAAWVMGGGDLQKMRSNRMDPTGMGLTQAGWICGIIGTLLQALGCLAICGFFGLAMVAGAAAPPPRPAPRPATFKFAVDPVQPWLDAARPLVR